MEGRISGVDGVESARVLAGQSSAFALPGKIFAPAVAAGVVGILSAVGNSGGFLGPTLTGALRESTGGFGTPFLVPAIQQRWADQHHVDREFWTKAGDAGLLCLGLPEQYGGGGGNFGHEAVVQQELALAHDTAFGFNVHSTIVAHYIAAYATE